MKDIVQDLDALREELERIGRLLTNRQRRIASYAESIQGAITTASVQTMLECKHQDSEPIQNDYAGGSPTAQLLLKLAKYGDDGWATPLMEKAEEVEELEVVMKCLALYKHLLDEESWRKSQGRNHAENLLALSHRFCEATDTIKGDSE